jgi:hypothetical protein
MPVDTFRHEEGHAHRGADGGELWLSDSHNPNSAC